MMRSWKLGKAFGIPLFVHPTFLLAPALAVLANGSAGGLGRAIFLVVLVVALFACVLLHELGHALMARRYGINTRDITLYPIGGVARLERMSEQPSEELLISLAGPAVNVVLFALLLPFFTLLMMLGGVQSAGWLGTLTRFVFGLGAANLGLVVFNLLPVFPMDGGRALRALLAMRFGLLRATEIAATIGLVLAACLGALALWNGIPMLLAVMLFIGYAGQQELQALRHREGTAGAGKPLPEEEPPTFEPYPQNHRAFGSATPPAGFTGFTFDPFSRIWVRWESGRPVAAQWQPPA